MNILLLTAVNPFSYQIVPDLGLMYLASTLRKAGLNVSVHDFRRDRGDYDLLTELIHNIQPTIVGIKCFSFELPRVKEMAEIIRRAYPQTLIVIGGPHPSMDPAGTLNTIPDADYAFLGESEYSFTNFALWIKQGGQDRPPENIRGIAYRDSSEIVTREPAFQENLDLIPMPAWDLLPPNSYPDEATGIFVPGFPASPMMLSRGCPYACTYCGARHVMGERIRYRSPENVLEEIAYLEREHGVRNFTFVDDNFTCSRPRAIQLFEALANRPRRVAFTFPNGVRIDTLDEELLKLMERAGCYSLALGIESGSDQTLVRMKKKQTVESVVKVVNLIRSTTSIRVTGFFILGYPGETIQDVCNTIKFAAELPIHHPHFCVFAPLYGSPVYDELRKQGLIPASGLRPEEMTFDRPMSLPGLPPRKLIILHHYAYLRFYLKPWRIWNLMKEIKSSGNLWVIIRRIIKLLGTR